jgi:hypothetical protein
MNKTAVSIALSLLLPLPTFGAEITPLAAAPDSDEAVLSFETPIYCNMPVWVRVALPRNVFVRYPFNVSTQNSEKEVLEYLTSQP